MEFMPVARSPLSRAENDAGEGRVGIIVKNALLLCLLLCLTAGADTQVMATWSLLGHICFDMNIIL